VHVSTRPSLGPCNCSSPRLARGCRPWSHRLLQARSCHRRYIIKANAGDVMRRFRGVARLTAALMMVGGAGVGSAPTAIASEAAPAAPAGAQSKTLTVTSDEFLATGHTVDPPLAAISFGDPPATATATPSTELEDGDVVTVSWAGFPASQPLAMTQCTGTVDPTERGQCDLVSYVQRTSDASGAGSMSFTVHTGAIGTRGGTCDAENDCVVLVADFGAVSRAVSVLGFAAGQQATTSTTEASGGATTDTTGAVDDAGLARTVSSPLPIGAVGMLAIAMGAGIVIAVNRRTARRSG
jgi:Neocarzinostatin family